MSEAKHYVAFEITEKGLSLRQKAIAEGYTVDFTRGALGEGRPDEDTDLFYMTKLVSHSADAPIKESYASKNNHIMAVVIDGLGLQNNIVMTEIGIFARLLDPATLEEIMPEILYGYTYTDKYDYVPAGESYNLYREIAFDTVLSRNGKFKIVYDKSKVYVTRDELDKYGAGIIGYDNALSGLEAETAQGAIDEIAAAYQSPSSRMPAILISEDEPGEPCRLHFKILKHLTNWITPSYNDELPLQAFLRLDNGESFQGSALLDSGEMKEMYIIPENNGS